MFETWRCPQVKIDEETQEPTEELNAEALSICKKLGSPAKTVSEAEEDVFLVGDLLRGLPAVAADDEAAVVVEAEEEEEEEREKEMIILTTSGFPLMMSVILSTCGRRWISSCSAVLNSLSMRNSSRGLDP